MAPGFSINLCIPMLVKQEMQLSNPNGLNGRLATRYISVLTVAKQYSHGQFQAIKKPACAGGGGYISRGRILAQFFLFCENTSTLLYLTNFKFPQFYFSKFCAYQKKLMPSANKCRVCLEATLSTMGEIPLYVTETLMTCKQQCGRHGTTELSRGSANCPPIQEPTCNSRRQQGHMRQVPYWEHTDMRHHCTESSRRGNLGPGVCVSLNYRVYCGGKVRTVTKKFILSGAQHQALIKTLSSIIIHLLQYCTRCTL